MGRHNRFQRAGRLGGLANKGVAKPTSAENGKLGGRPLWWAETVQKHQEASKVDSSLWPDWKCKCDACQAARLYYKRKARATRKPAK